MGDLDQVPLDVVGGVLPEVGQPVGVKAHSAGEALLTDLTLMTLSLLSLLQLQSAGLEGSKVRDTELLGQGDEPGHLQLGDIHLPGVEEVEDVGEVLTIDIEHEERSLARSSDQVLPQEVAVGGQHQLVGREGGLVITDQCEVQQLSSLSHLTVHIPTEMSELDFSRPHFCC